MVLGGGAEIAQVLGHLCRGTGGVVGDVAQPDADPGQPAQRLDGPGNGVRARVDNAVKIGEQGIKGGDQGGTVMRLVLHTFVLGRL